MSHQHRLRRPERIRPASLPLRGPLDALDVVLAIVSWPLRPETVCLLLDEAHCGLGSFVVAHDDHGGVDAAVVEVVTHVAGGASPVAAAVLATMRPGVGPPEGADHLHFLDYRAHLEDVGVVLLDWFVLDGELGYSLAELTDATSRWRGER
jgi:hypothetical protein